MNRGNFIPELPCEQLVRNICGGGWRNLPDREIDGAWGVAIVQSILDGARPTLREISSHLGIEKDQFEMAFIRLNLNGILQSNHIIKDKKVLRSGDVHAWCQYAGFASGFIGPVMFKN